MGDGDTISGDIRVRGMHEEGTWIHVGSGRSIHRRFGVSDSTTENGVKGRTRLDWSDGGERNPRTPDRGRVTTREGPGSSGPLPRIEQKNR